MSTHRGTDALLGREIAGYRIEELIGRGGMGAVYRAGDEQLGRNVALKVIAPELAQDSRFRERFLRESRLAASLDHPHVVPIHQAGEADGQLFLAMRYVEGTDLARLLAEQGTLDPRRAIALLSQIAEALDAAHEKGLIHRDVKPSNILVATAAGEEHCYLADFGLTKRTGSLSGVTAPGDIVGTLEYVAPEQITGGELDERSDVYSLGCVLYESLTGQPPFPRATDVALLWAHVHEEPGPPSKLRPELPRELDSVLTRALAKEPGRRYRSAGELAAAARSALGLAEALPAARRPRWVLAAAGAAALALAAIAVTLVFTLGSGSGGLSAISPNAVGVIDPETNKLVAEVPVGARPGAVAAGEGAVWVANRDDETVSRIDAATRRSVGTVPVLGHPSDVAVDSGSVWVALGNLAKLRRIDAGFNETDNPISVFKDAYPAPTIETEIAVGAGAVWYLWGLSTIARVDARTGEAHQAGLDDFQLVFQAGQPTTFYDVAVAFGSVWLPNRVANSLTQFDPASDRVVGQVTVGKEPQAVAFGEESLWVANFGDDTVSRIDPPSLAQSQGVTVKTIPVGDGPVDLAVGEGAVWVANSLDGTVSRIDPETNDVVATIEVGERPQRIAAGEGAVWVTLRGQE